MGLPVTAAGKETRKIGFGDLLNYWSQSSSCQLGKGNWTAAAAAAAAVAPIPFFVLVSTFSPFCLTRPREAVTNLLSIDAVLQKSANFSTLIVFPAGNQTYMTRLRRNSLILLNS
jgi:hypothetical protein